jgi:hypothetical protein
MIFYWKIEKKGEKWKFKGVAQTENYIKQNK